MYTRRVVHSSIEWAIMNLRFISREIRLKFDQSGFGGNIIRDKSGN